MNIEDLPKLTTQQQKFLLQYFSNGKNASEAYRYAYNCEGMKKTSIWVEASKLLKNPNVTLWIEYYTANQEEVITNEINYSAKECFENIKELQLIALESKDKNGNPNVNAAIKAEELKGKLGNHFKEKLTLEASNKFSLFMGKVEEKAQNLEANINEGSKK